MDSSKIKALIIVVLALCFALYLGITAATAQMEALIWVAGGLFLTTCFLLGRHIWILIPATLGMRGGINFLPGAIEPWHLATAVVGVLFLIRIATRQQRIAFKWSSLDTAVFLIAITILQAFVRNPTGLMVFGGDTAGGRAYLVFMVAIAAFVLIGMADADIKSFRWAVLLHVGFTAIDGIVSMVSGLIPAFATAVLPYYSNVSIDATATLQYSGNVEDSRITQFGQLGSLLGLVACSFWRPVAALDIRKPWRAVTALASVAAVLLSGFRGTAGSLFVRFVVGSLVRRKPLDVLIVSLLGFLAAMAIIAVVPVNDLPYSLQRVLSMVPGVTVREEISREAQDSVDLRVRMWEEALLTDRYIDNKMLGDGFGMRQADAALMSLWATGDKHIRETVHVEEILMANGAYHGFHAEVIRFTGAVGLLAATVAMFVFLVFAKRSINAYRDHPYWGYVIFICLPFLIMPFWYWLVYGDYRQMFPPALATAGMLKLLWAIKRKEQSLA
jgi:hypothetical protein